jgi:hypothetical protein
MNSLTIENFSMGFYKLVACFEFNYDDHYLQMVYDVLKDQLNDQMFLETCSGAPQLSSLSILCS